MSEAMEEPLDGDLHMALLDQIHAELRRIRELLERQQEEKAQAERERAEKAVR
ncbi:hypothetical protein J4G48_0003445 [Bradyrhizobium barranii subsp. apii]|uniref:hypothetical protein n=1 Tax=Bradyrhizobium barranii TaxID=2992140 RepID=UPI001AA13FA7|nr:hypothetical protein [Bradyrhizobium barranii]UPT97250.1 hypothetical protein J4G48_0003445 [Bradyrhizobium barranii subsp. apii]